jgi:hypothetical protein
MKTADHKRMASSRLFRQSGVVACATPRLFVLQKESRHWRRLPEVGLTGYFSNLPEPLRDLLARP